MTDPTSFAHVSARPPEPAGAALAAFVACAQSMLDPATPEDRRRQAETQLLQQLPVVRALGVFELFDVRDPALATLLRDELGQLARRDAQQRDARCAGARAARR